MKRLLSILLIAAATLSATWAQTTKDLRTENDGFKWYNTFSSDSRHQGAESSDGTTLIPLSRGYTFICYHSESYGCGYFGVRKNGKEGVCNIKGKEIIAPERGYDKIYLFIESPNKGYYKVVRNSKQGACDLKGKEIIAPQYETLFYTDNGFKYETSQGSFQPLSIFLDNYDIASEYKPSKSSTKNKKESKERESTSSSTSSYSSARFSNFSLEHNVPNGGRTMLKANYDLEVTGCKGHKMLVYLNILDENRNKIRSVYTKLSKAPYQTTQWNNIWIGIYNDHLYAKQGTHTYYAQMSVVDKKTKKTLATSDLIAFEMTGSQQYNNYTPQYQYNIPPSNYQQPNNNNNNQSGSYSYKCKRCGGDGRCRGYGNTTAYMNMHCAGTGKCSTCGGKGYTINHYTNNNMVCPTCNGNGKCKQCNGTGICQKCGGSGKE
ncbi:MAG: WG repeat-containing protein [Bacteroidales bacterium]|nr:WG repeat-containing protein [Bacteroidales bacterium]